MAYIAVEDIRAELDAEAEEAALYVLMVALGVRGYRHAAYVRAYEAALAAGEDLPLPM